MKLNKVAQKKLREEQGLDSGSDMKIFKDATVGIKIKCTSQEILEK